MASRSVRSIKKKLSDAWTCGICKEKMIDPRFIRCGHSFCKNCIAKLCENSQNPNETITFKCPLCRVPFTLGSDGVDGLPINYSLKDIAENCPSMESSDEGSLQDQTDDTERCTECKVQLEAIQICVDCNIRLCKSCSQDHQSHHDIMDVKDFQHIMGEFAGDNTCHEHSSQILEMYCTDDDIPVCNTCVLLKHTHHKIISLSDHVAKKRRYLTKLESSCNRLLHEYDCKELRVKEKRDILAKNTTAAKDYADEIARDVTVMILKEKESLLQDKQENSKKSESRILSCMAQMKSSRQKTKDLYVRIKYLKRYGSFRSIAEDKMSKNLWSEISKNRKSTDASEINIDVNFSRTEFLTRCTEGMQSMLQDQNPQRHQSPQIQASHNAMGTHNTPGPGSQISSDETVLTSHQELDLDEETGVKKIYQQEDENTCSYYKNRIQNEAESDTRQEYDEMDLMRNIHGADERSVNGDPDDAFSHQLMRNNAVVQEQISDGELMEDGYYNDIGVTPECLSTDPNIPRKLPPRKYQSGNLQQKNEGSRSDLRRNESDDDIYSYNSDGQNIVGCPDDVIEVDQTHEERCIDPREDVLGATPECLSTDPNITPNLPPRRYQSGNLQQKNEGSRSDLRRNESDDDIYSYNSDGQNIVGCPDDVIEVDQTHEERCIDPREDILDKHEREVDGEMHIPECQMTAERQFCLKISVSGLAMTPKDEIVVVLENNKAVLVFDLRGKLIAEVISDSIGNPRDLTIVNDDGNEWTVYLTDSGERTHGVKTIKKHKKKYKVDSFTKDVKTPCGICSSRSNIFVCDISPQNIKVFAIRTRICERIIKNEQFFHTPVYISTTQEGDMVVTSLTSSKGDGSICIITPEGSRKQVYGPSFPKPFSPTQTCIHPNGNLYIADQGSKEIYFISTGKISKLPYRKFNITPTAMSFDKCGDLWVSSILGQFVKFTL